MEEEQLNILVCTYGSLYIVIGLELRLVVSCEDLLVVMSPHSGMSTVCTVFLDAYSK
jgi:hypothetical protein